jgi:hypothetical protein
MFYLLLQKIKDIYNEMAKRREKQTMVHKTLHRKLTITSHGGVCSGEVNSQYWHVLMVNDTTTIWCRNRVEDQ